MEKTIIIEGRPVRFKASGGLMLRYKAQFGREYMADAMSLEEFARSAKRDENGKIVSYDYTKLNLEVMYNILWTMAKAADPGIPDPITWLDSFDQFPVFQIYNELKDIMAKNMKVDQKNVQGTVGQATVHQFPQNNLFAE